MGSLYSELPVLGSSAAHIGWEMLSRDTVKEMHHVVVTLPTRFPSFIQKTIIICPYPRTLTRM